MTRPGSGWPHGRSVDGGVDVVPVPGLPGRLWLCGKHAIAPEPDRVLAATGARHVVCLVERHEVEHRYPHYVAWLEDRRPDGATWLPTADLSVPSFAEFAALVEGVHGRLLVGDDVVVHCAAGIGRAGTVAIGVLLRGGLTRMEAAEHLTRHRPMAGPEAGVQSELLEAYLDSLG